MISLFNDNNISNNLTKEIKTYLFNSGYNKRSFEYCCGGVNFKTVEKEYYNRY